MRPLSSRAVQVLHASLAHALRTAKPAEHPPIRGYDRERGRHEQWNTDCLMVAQALCDNDPAQFNRDDFLKECDCDNPYLDKTAPRLRETPKA